jgi:hypothetical protein
VGQDSAAAQDVRISFSALVQGKNAWGEWTVTGRVKKAISFAATKVQFGRHSVESQPLKPQKVGIRVDQGVKAVHVSGDIPELRFEILTGAEGHTLSVTPNGKVGCKEYRGTASVVAELADGTRAPQRLLPVVAIVTEDIEAHPPSVLFAPRNIGEIATETVTLTSLTNRPIRDVAVRCEGTGIEATTLRDGVGWTVPIALRIATAADNRGTLIVTVETEDGVRREIKVPVSGQGLAGGR